MATRSTSRTARRWRLGLLAFSATGALLLAGCASADDSGGGDDGPQASADPEIVATGWVNGGGEDGDPQTGGELAYATYTPVTALDPAARQDGGGTGGSEMAAIYDLLVRYDYDQSDYVPHLAEKLESDDDHQMWTLTLPEDVTFSDGTPLDADAVVESTARYVEQGGTHAQLWADSVEEVTAEDARTVVYELTGPWPEFPSMLTTGPGMIVAPSATDGEEFTPIGAGPFTVDGFDPGTELRLTAREDYWGGEVPLDRLTFPTIVAEESRVESVQSGDVQVAYVRNVGVVYDAIEDGVAGWGYGANMSGNVLINSRDGRAGADERVRQAIVAAVDPQFLNERIDDGRASVSSAMFQSWSTWYDGRTHDDYDPDAARELLDQAKADGYDGTLSYAGINSPTTMKSAVAIQTMLEAVGFTVELDLAPDAAGLVRTMYAEHDYDIGYSAFNVLDEDPFVRLYGNLYSTSTGNAMGFADPEMDALLMQVQAAGSDDERREVLGEIQDLVDQTAPFAPVSGSRTLIAMGDDVRGVVPSLDGIMLFHSAWEE